MSAEDNSSTTEQQLVGCICVVTGASRGAGRGIALALGAAGATVYVTGRTVEEGVASLPGTIGATADEISATGSGTGVAVACDHADDTQVSALFERVADESGGCLDILVNNATDIHDQLIEAAPFWEKSLALVDILDVGLRSAYVASYYAAPLMVARREGLICFTSSFGGACYMHGPAYGAQKAGVDKFAADMAVDLREHDVASASLWLGLLHTERTERVFKEKPEAYAELEPLAEWPQFTGRVIAALYRDPERMAKSGRTFISAELGAEYGILDIDGKAPVSHRPLFGDPREPHPAIVR